MPYRNKQEAVTTLRPGWTITGEAPYMVAVPNPQAGRPGEPATTQQQQGTILSIYDPANPNNPPDTVIIKEVGNAPWKGGVGYDVVQGPTHALPNAPTTPTATAALDKLDANGDPLPAGSTAKAAFVRDPKTGTTFAVSGDVPTDPATWTKVFDPNDTTKVIALFDPANSKIAATVPQGSTTPKRSGDYTDLVDPNDPSGKRVIGKIDTGSKEIFAVSRDPSTQKQIVSTPEKIFVFDDAGKVINEVSIDKKSPYQAVLIDGTPYSFDPNETDPNKRFTKAPGDWQHPPIKDAQQNTMTWDEGQGKYAYPPGVTPAATLSTVTGARNLEWYDAQGNLIKSVPNANYQPPQGAQGQQSTTAPMIQQWNPQTNAWDWVENKGRVTASAALQNMASILSGQVVDGTVSLEDAKALIEGSHTAMTDAISAASNVLDYTAKGAQTGAGMLQQRAATAQGMLGTVLGMAGNRSPSGKYGGGMLSAPAGLGGAITGGIQNYTADLMGGQPTLDAAARMVQAAGGGDTGSPQAASAIGVLSQMMDRYKQMTGTAHPIEQAHVAAQASEQANGVVAPNPQTAPLFTSPWQRADQAQGLAPAGNAMAPAGMTGTVQPGSPQYLGTPPAFAQSGMAEGSGRGFTAPQAAPTVVLNVSS